MFNLFIFSPIFVHNLHLLHIFNVFVFPSNLTPKVNPLLSRTYPIGMNAGSDPIIGLRTTIICSLFSFDGDEF